MTPLRRRLATGDPLFGTFLTLGSALATEACALAGFDWLLVDLEHGGGDEGALVHQQLAADAHDVPLLVRVESEDRIRSGRALDIGAAGVMFPRLDSRAQAEAAVRHLRYPPLGDRGVATSTRMCGFGLRPEALTTADATTLCVIQIETRSAVENVEQIASIPGVDVLFVGPRDLTHDLGVPGNPNAPEFHAALTRIAEAADTTGIALGVLAPNAQEAHHYANLGYRFIGIASDATLLTQAGRHLIDTVAR